MAAKTGRHKLVEHQGEASASSAVGGAPNPDRHGPASVLNGASASAIGMGLAMQGGATEVLAEGVGDAVVDDAADKDQQETADREPEVLPEQSSTETPFDGPPVDTTEVVPEEAEELAFAPEGAALGPVSAAGRTSEIEDAGTSAEIMATMLADDEAGEIEPLRKDETVQPEVTLPFEDADDSETEGPLDPILDPVIGDDGVVDNVLDTLLGEGGVLDGLLGEDGILDDVLGGLIGDDGIIDLTGLENLLGEDGYLGGAINVILGDEGLLADILGEGGLADDLLEPLVSDGGVLDSLLSPVLGGGAVDDLLGEGSVVPGAVEDLFGDDGLVDEIIGDVPIVGDMLGPDGLLGSVLGEGSALGGLLGLGSDDAEQDSDPLEADETAEDDGFLNDLLGIGATTDDVTDVVADIGGGVSFDAVGDLMSGLLSDEDTFGVDVPDSSSGGLDDLYAGLVGENSLTGSLVGEGLLGSTTDPLLADDEIDNLLSEILGPSSSDVTGGGDLFDALFEDDSTGETDQVGGLLGDVSGLADGVLSGLDADGSLLDGLLSGDDDNV